MDQVRTALAWLKKHHFWVLTGLVVFIALGCWWSAAKKMSAKYDADQKHDRRWLSVQVDRFTKRASMRTIRSTTTKSEKSKSFRRASPSCGRCSTTSSAKTFCNGPAALSKAFRDAVEKMQFNEDISRELRDNYQNYIEKHFPELPKQIIGSPDGSKRNRRPGRRRFHAHPLVRGCAGRRRRPRRQRLHLRVARPRLSFAMS